MSRGYETTFYRIIPHLISSLRAYHDSASYGDWCKMLDHALAKISYYYSPTCDVMRLATVCCDSLRLATAGRIANSKMTQPNYLTILSLLQ